jgi:hypothetical protein
MPWARDAVEAGIAALIRSARSLLTATTPVMDVGTDADRIGIEIPVLEISSDAIAATETGTIDGNVDAVIATVIGTDVGDVRDKR